MAGRLRLRVELQGPKRGRGDRLQLFGALLDAGELLTKRQPDPCRQLPHSRPDLLLSRRLLLGSGQRPSVARFQYFKAENISRAVFLSPSRDHCLDASVTQTDLPRSEE